MIVDESSKKVKPRARSTLEPLNIVKSTDCLAYPTFSPNVRVTDISHQPNCLMFGGGSVAFHGDYIELDARGNSSGHTVHVAWADNRDVAECDLDPALGPDSNNTGNRNQNIYADTLTVGP
ncbi:MAG TPA: hypothetical protein VLC52_00445 [Anaerolineae bacterium]|nr:hypothetical protein [Anaerolineae bacterium]